MIVFNIKIYMFETFKSLFHFPKKCVPKKKCECYVAMSSTMSPIYQ